MRKVGEPVLDAQVLEGVQADVGELVVPENRAQENTRLISLPVMRLHSVSKTPSEPVFLLEGGPGLPNLKLQQLPHWLIENHDVVMVGYRGVDGPVSLSVPELNALLKGNRDLLGHDSLQAIGAGLTQAAQRLQQEGIDLRGYGVLDVVDDLEDARQALGYGPMNLIGGSYGGAVAYACCVRYAASIHRCILSEAAFPFNVGVAEPQDVDRKLRRLNELWQQSERRAASADIVQTIRQVLATLPQQWNGIEIDPGKVKLMTFLGLYTQETIAQTFDAFVAAEQGDLRGLAFMTVMWGHVVDWFNWGEMFSKLYSTRTGQERDYEHEMDPPGSIIGSPLSKLGWATLKYGDWPVKPLPAPHRTPQHSQIETLLIYGSRESTPQAYVSYFDKGNWVTLQDVGHMDVGVEQAEASVHLQRRFLLEGLVDTSMYQEAPPVSMNFFPRQSYPEQAKELLATGAP